MTRSFYSDYPGSVCRSAPKGEGLGVRFSRGEDARRDLNRVYDRFVRGYGPINKTTFSESPDGAVTRRMPNLVKFRDDPDAMLVMALEDYDEATGKAVKDAFYAESADHTLVFLDHVTRTRAPALYRGTYQPSSTRTQTEDTIFLPLSNDGEAVNMILVYGHIQWLKDEEKL